MNNDRDIGKILLAKNDTIIESWIESIRDDADVKSSKNMAHNSVRNSIPPVIKAIATLFSDSLANRPDKLKDNSLEHGIVRAEQGYNVAEIVREYALLRKIIFAVLKPDLLAGTGAEILHNVELIDGVIDQVVSLSLESYIEMRLKELKQLQSQLIFTNQELTRLAADQKEDLSHLAHEIKNPLNSIMGFSTLLLQQQQQLGQGKDSSLSLKLTENVIKNSKQLLRLINDYTRNFPLRSWQNGAASRICRRKIPHSSGCRRFRIFCRAKEFRNSLELRSRSCNNIYRPLTATADYNQPD